MKVNYTPGAKPPANEQLGADVGILITGCQSNETSADACPSGNPDKAHGALSNAIQTVIKQQQQQSPGQPITYRCVGRRRYVADWVNKQLAPLLRSRYLCH